MNVDNRTLFIADNLDIMRGMDSETIDLIYLDPPFQHQSALAVEGTDRFTSRGSGTFKDIWTDADIKDEWHSDRSPQQHPGIISDYIRQSETVPMTNP